MFSINLGAITKRVYLSSAIPTGYCQIRSPSETHLEYGAAPALLGAGLPSFPRISIVSPNCLNPTQLPQIPRLPPLLVRMAYT